MKEQGYARIDISLEKEANDKLLHLEGDYLSVVTISGVGSCKIRLNHRHSPEINLREVSNVTGTFDKLYLTTDGGGGTCTTYIGVGEAISITPDAAKLWAGGVASTQITTSLTVVEGFCNEMFRLTELTIINTSGFYACYVGPYNSNAAYFKSKAYVLMPHAVLRFATAEMSSLACISYDGVNNVTLGIIGLLE